VASMHSGGVMISDCRSWAISTLC